MRLSKNSEMGVSLKVLNRLRIAGAIAELVKARKGHKCHICGLPIEQGEEHYCIYIGGGGLGSLKFPDRAHLQCLDDYSKKELTKRWEFIR
jgi:hypothetical protein